MVERMAISTNGMLSITLTQKRRVMERNSGSAACGLTGPIDSSAIQHFGQAPG